MAAEDGRYPLRLAQRFGGAILGRDAGEAAGAGASAGAGQEPAQSSTKADGGSGAVDADYEIVDDDK